MEDDSPQDEFKISEEKLKQYLQSSQKDRDYDGSSDKSRMYNSRPIRDEIIEMIEKVHQAVLKLDKGTESQVERCINLIERLSDTYVNHTDILAEQNLKVEKLQKNAKNNNKIIAILTGLTLLSMCCSLTILGAVFMNHH